jgi:surface antigen
MMRKFMAALLVASLPLAGCAQLQESPKESVGTLAGAAAGGLLGSQIGGGTGRMAATGAGVLLGGILGNQIGRSLDRADRLAMQQVTHTALETGRTGVAVPWQNPDTGNFGAVTPLRTTESGNTVCREYQQTITVAGRTEEGYGTACRQPDGSWRIVR